MQLTIKHRDGSRTVIRPAVNDLDCSPQDLVNAITGSGRMRTVTTNKSIPKQGFVKNYRYYVENP